MSTADAEMGCRAFLSEADLKALDESLAKDGLWTIDDVRAAVAANRAKDTADMRGEGIVLDPELLFIVDLRTDFDLFIIGDAVHDISELVSLYPQLGTSDPRALCAQQELAVFEALAGGDQDFAVRDAGVDGDFMLVADEVRRVITGRDQHVRSPSHVALTHIYVGRDSWADFKLARRMARVVSTFSAHPALCGPAAKAPLAITFAAEPPAVPSKLHASPSKSRSLLDLLQELETTSTRAAAHLLDSVEDLQAMRADMLQTLESRAACLRKREAELIARENMLIDGLAGLASLAR